MKLPFCPRRGIYADITDELETGETPLSSADVGHLETFDLIYRSLYSLLFNYVPTSGHPGGSISSGRFVTSLLFEAMGITGFTLPTMYRWVRSDRGRQMTLHAFQKGHYLGSGQAEVVLTEAGLDGESQFRAIMRYVKGK